ncbi:MAG TPA: hypothetical protein VGC77_06555 [Rhodopseudomonas sp.]|uniref:hypothetical protein n=1 Tax=Rhodopseudomonas sp. TaxID=1078 RepID=UPI002EDAEB88
MSISSVTASPPPPPPPPVEAKPVAKPVEAKAPNTDDSDNADSRSAPPPPPPLPPGQGTRVDIIA